MQRVLVTFLALALVLAAMPVASQAGSVELTYSCFFPPTHVQSQLAEEWAKEVEKRTNGEVTVAYFPGGTLTNAKQCYDGVVEGLSDIGFSVLAYSQGRFPTMAAVDLPLGYTSGVTATQVANAVYEKFAPKEFDDVQVMYFHAHGPGLLFTAKKPVKVLEDMQGLKLRATGNSGKLVQALGATAVAGSMSDAYQSIQKGVVDGGMYPMETNKGWKMAEVVDYCTETFDVAYTTTFFVVMNKDKWNSLSPEAQKAITELNVEFAAKHGKAWDESDVAGKAFFEEQGGETVSLSDEESQRWVEAAKPVLAEYVAAVSEKGIDGQAVVDFVVKTLSELQ